MPYCNSIMVFATFQIKVSTCYNLASLLSVRFTHFYFSKSIAPIFAKLTNVS
jgi:hypothetical protein